jgi:hypothetical protein
VEVDGASHRRERPVLDSNVKTLKAKATFLRRLKDCRFFRVYSRDQPSRHYLLT